MDYEEKRQFEDEIDLMDYVKVLLKRKWLILVVFLMAVIIAGAFSYLMPKIYKIDTSLEIGRIGEEVVRVPEQVAGKIDGDIYGVFVREKLGIPETEYPKTRAENPKNTELITMVIESSETEKAKDVLEEINKLILAEHQEITQIKKELTEKDIKTTENKLDTTQSDIERIERKTKTIQEDIQTTRNKIKPVENDIERIELKIESAQEEKENLEKKVESLQETLVYEQTPGTQFALFDAKEKLANKKQEIEDLYLRINSSRRTIEDYNLQINSLERTIEDYNSQVNSQKRVIEDYHSQINSLKASLKDIRPTQIVKTPYISENPIKPRPLLNIVIAAILGLFIGVILAFSKEWWEKSK